LENLENEKKFPILKDNDGNDDKANFKSNTLENNDDDDDDEFNFKLKKIGFYQFSY